MSRRMTPRSRRHRNGEDATVERTTVVRPVGGEFQVVAPDYMSVTKNITFAVGEPQVTHTVRFSDLPHDTQVMLAKQGAAIFTRDRWRKDHYEEEEVEREVERSYPYYLREFTKDNSHGLFVTDDGAVVVAHHSQYQYGEVIGTLGTMWSFNTLGFTVRKFNGQTPKKLDRHVHSGPLSVDIQTAHGGLHQLEFEPSGWAVYEGEPTLADYGWETIVCPKGSDNDYIFSVSATKDFRDYYATWGDNPVMNPCVFDLTRPSKVVYASLANDLPPPARAENPRHGLRRPRR